MPTEPTFARGRLILHRNLGGHGIGWVRPAYVVADDERGLLLWVAPGSPVVVEKAADGRDMRDMTFAEWITLEHRPTRLTWRGPGVLKFHPPDAGHSVWFFRTASGAFAGWYVNLEERALRWDDGEAAGIDVVDQDLDVWVRPDRSWEWKDEHELAERLAYPEHYWVRSEAPVRAEGERVIKQVEAGEFPFDGTWTDFEPDPAWTAPADLPAGWDRPAMPR